MSTFEKLPDELTHKQEAILKDFRSRVTDVLKPHHDDFFLLRWLKARNFEISRAESMLRESLIWRERYGADTLLDWEPPAILRQYWPGGIFGFDNYGHPILWQVSRDFDASGMMKSVKKSDIIKYHVYRMEKIMHRCNLKSKELGKRVGSAVHISDLDGFSLKMVFTPGISNMMKEIFALLEANYPEDLHSSYVINAPGVFAVFFNLLRPFLSEETKRKVNILGRNWQEKLKQVIPASELPEYWGGDARMPDAECTDHINVGGKVPTSFYSREHLILDRDKMTSHRLLRGATYSLKYKVCTPGTVIRWTFATDQHDIGFGLYYVAGDLADEHNDGEWEELMTVSRVNSQLVPEDGSIRCSRTGTYILKWDNSYSWVHGKKILHDVEMIEPDLDPMFEEITNSDVDKEVIESIRL